MGLLRRRALVPALLAAAIAVPAAERPNLVVLLADDMRADALGAAGNPIVRTPNLDRLAADGVRFRNAFVTTPLCAPSRASIFSGQWVRRHGIDDFTTGFSDDAWSRTYPALLRAAGYRTGFIGKFGVGAEPRATAYDFWRGFPGQGSYFAPDRPQHLTAWMGDQALAFLADQTPGRPFCLAVSFKAPHMQDGSPRDFPPDPRDEALYATTPIPTAAKTEDAFFRRLPLPVQRSAARRRWEHSFSTPELAARNVRDYYRLVTGLDREVGRIRAALAERGLANDTVVVFLSDNGYQLGERGLGEKWFLWEESLRVPLVVLDPFAGAARRGAVVDALALNVDVAPTLLDYAGVPAPPAMQGRTLRPVVAGDAARLRGGFLAEHHFRSDIIPPSEGVRSVRWKYVRWSATMPVVEELYDLRRDPEERVDLASDPRSADRLAWARRRWARLAGGLR